MFKKRETDVACSNKRFRGKKFLFISIAVFVVIAIAASLMIIKYMDKKGIEEAQRVERERVRDCRTCMDRFYNLSHNDKYEEAGKYTTDPEECMRKFDACIGDGVMGKVIRKDFYRHMTMSYDTPTPVGDAYKINLKITSFDPNTAAELYIVYGRMLADDRDVLTSYMMRYDNSVDIAIAIWEAVLEAKRDQLTQTVENEVYFVQKDGKWLIDANKLPDNMFMYIDENFQ